MCFIIEFMDIFILNRNNQKIRSKDTKMTIAIVVPTAIVITAVIVLLRSQLTEERAGETSGVRLGMTISTTQEGVRTR